MTEHQSRYDTTAVLVTGGAGAIGSNLVRALCRLNAEVVVLDDLSSGFEWLLPQAPNLTMVRGSVVDPAALKAAFAHSPRVVFHLAAFFANQNSVEHPERDLEVNGMGTLRVLEQSRKSAVERFVFAASGCSLVGPRTPLPASEDSVSLDLTTPYQITKLVGEMYTSYFHQHWGLETVCLRLFNSYGPGEVPGLYRNVIPNMIYWALQGRPLPLTGATNASRDFTFVDDIVAAMLRAGHSDRAVGQQINIASGRETRISDLAEKINRLTENSAGCRKAPARSWDKKQRILASVEKAKECLEFEASVFLEEGLSQTVEWFQQNWEMVEAEARFDGVGRELGRG